MGMKEWEYLRVRGRILQEAERGKRTSTLLRWLQLKPLRFEHTKHVVNSVAISSTHRSTDQSLNQKNSRIEKGTERERDERIKSTE